MVGWLGHIRDCQLMSEGGVGFFSIHIQLPVCRCEGGGEVDLGCKKGKPGKFEGMRKGEEITVDGGLGWVW